MTLIPVEPETREFVLIDFGGHRHADRYECSVPGCDLDALWLLGDDAMCDPCAVERGADVTVIVEPELGEPER